jgi:uncharacterized protein (TIGR03790 family)
MLALLLLLAAGCSAEPQAPAPAPTTAESRRVMVIINQSSPESREIGAYYAARRGIPQENVLRIKTVTTETVTAADYPSQIERPVKVALDKSKNEIDFIVLTKGVPIRISPGKGYSVDGHLAAMDLPFAPMEEPEREQLERALSPYYNKNGSFSHKLYGFRLATRLDGYTVEHAKRLVDNSLAAQPHKGLFFFDMAASRATGGSKPYNDMLKHAHEIMEAKDLQSRLETTGSFIAPEEPLAGYASWGSNDAGFNLDVYRRLRFRPGAIAETYVSTSGRTFNRTTGGQSLIADLIENGVTGVKGYVSEPYTFALAQPHILFDRYTAGFNLAESFYMASPILKWKDVVIGDPLCAPYKRR